jgi:hypothetical protein
MKNILYFGLGLFLLIFTNCKKEIVVPEKVIYEPRFDITDAKMIFTVDDYSLECNIYKLTDNNEIKNLILINTDGTQVYETPITTTWNGVSSCLNGSNFILMFHNIGEWDSAGLYTTFQGISIVDKLTGKEIHLEGGSIPDIGANLFLNDYQIKNSSNNFYFNSYGTTYRISSSFYLSQFSPTGKAITKYEINQDDYMLFLSDGQFFLENSFGSLISISDFIGYPINAIWKGSDGYFYLFVYNTDTSKKTILRLLIDGYNVTYETLIQDADPTFYVDNISYFSIEFSGAVMFIPKDKGYSGTSWIYYESSKVLEDISSNLPEYEEIIDVDESTGYFYVATTDNIYKFDLDLQYTALFESSKYEIYAMCVNQNNEVLFNALRYSDGKAVIGSFDDQGNLTIIDNQLNKRVQYFEFI